MPDTDSGAVAERYFEAWKSGDWAALRSLLSDDATFRGPLASIEGADGLVEGLKRMGRITTDIVVHKRFVDGPDVLTWFDLHTSIAPPAPTANWSHVENGRITAIQVTFDARDLAPPKEPSRSS
jgi:SnoaL-like protein